MMNELPIVEWTEAEREVWRGTRYAAFKKSWRQPKPTPAMIMAEIKSQLRVCLTHLDVLSRLLDEVCADGPEAEG